MSYYMAGAQRDLDETWFRGEHCNFHPFKDSFSEPSALEKHVSAGWLPEAPLISRRDKITTFGSCFAQRVREFLARNGYSVASKSEFAPYIIRFGDGNGKHRGHRPTVPVGLP